jgi:RNA-binding protein YlmH
MHPMKFARARSAFLVAISLLVSIAVSRAQVGDVKALQEQFENLVGERVTSVYNAGLAKLNADSVDACRA